MIYRKNIRVDLSKRFFEEPIRLHEGDVNGCALIVAIFDDGAAFDLTGCEVKYDAVIAGHLAENDAAASFDGNAITVPITGNMTAKSGFLEIDVKIIKSGEILFIQTLQARVQRRVIDEETIIDISGTTIGQKLQDLEDGKADKATTLAGYGITDAYTKTQVDGLIPADASHLQTSFTPDAVLPGASSGYDFGTDYQSPFIPEEDITNRLKQGDLIKNEEGDLWICTSTSTSFVPPYGYEFHLKIVARAGQDISSKVDKTTTIAGIDLHDDITANELRTALNIGDDSMTFEEAYDCDVSRVPSGKTHIDNAIDYTKCYVVKEFISVGSYNAVGIMFVARGGSDGSLGVTQFRIRYANHGVEYRHKRGNTWGNWISIGSSVTFIDSATSSGWDDTIPTTYAGRTGEVGELAYYDTYATLWYLADVSGSSYEWYRFMTPDDLQDYVTNESLDSTLENYVAGSAIEGMFLDETSPYFFVTSNNTIIPSPDNPNLKYSDIYYRGAHVIGIYTRNYHAFGSGYITMHIDRAVYVEGSQCEFRGHYYDDNNQIVFFSAAGSKDDSAVFTIVQ